MKNKSDVLAKIKDLRTSKSKLRQNYSAKELRQPISLIDFSISTLQWVLGYKITNPTYYCFSCELIHPKLKCPKCGNEQKVNKGHYK